MPEDFGLRYAKRLQQRVGVVGELLERELIGWRFGGLAEADLVRDYDTIATCGEAARCVFPGRAAEVLAVKKHDGFVRCIAGRRNVHVGHREGLAL